jgi:hypothetical protein
MNFQSPGTFRPASLAAVALVCAACGGKPASEPSRAAQPEPVGNYFVGDEPLYAHLVNASGGSWVFTTVTRSDTPIDSGFLVRLNDLTPAFDIRVAECAPQAYPSQHRCSLTHPFREKDAGVLDKIINSSIAVGTAGKVTEISQTYETSFDEAAFNQAVDEALVNTGLDLSRRPLFISLQQYDAALAKGQAELDRLTRQATAARSNTNNVTLRIRPEVDGVTAYYGSDIDFAEVIKLSVESGTALPDSALQPGASVLPCDARYCAATAEKALRDLEANIAAHSERLASLAAPNTRAYKVDCATTTHDGYHLAITCPDVIEVAGNEPAVVPLGVTVLSRDFDSVYPELALTDSRLHVQVSDDAVRFTNATSDYLTLTAQTIYYNSKVHTTNAPIDLPPGVSIERDLAEFVSQPIQIESRYLQMTPDKAAGATFGFGYAVRYRAAATAGEVTLHDQGRYNVGCVIDRRLGRPAGACRVPEPGAATVLPDAAAEPVLADPTSTDAHRQPAGPPFEPPAHVSPDDATASDD